MLSYEIKSWKRVFTRKISWSFRKVLLMEKFHGLLKNVWGKSFDFWEKNLKENTMDFWKIVQRNILFVFVNLFSTWKVPHGFFGKWVIKYKHLGPVWYMCLKIEIFFAWKHLWKYMLVKKCIKIHVILFKN